MINILIFITVVFLFVVLIQLMDVYKLTQELKKESCNESATAGSEKSEGVEAAGEVSPEEKGKNPAISFGIVVIAVCAFYTFFANSIPQVEWHPPKKVEIAEDVSQKDLVKIGKGIFEGKGQCLLCHDVGGGGLRAPDLQGIGGRAGESREEYSSEDYLFESLYFPSVHVVEGYAPSMPPVNKPPSNLSEMEIVAVVAYLQNMGGETTITAQTKPDLNKIGK